MTGPLLRLQTASLYVSSYTAVFAGSGGPFGYSPETGQFGGVISSDGLATEPFSDSLAGVMAGDVVTFVTVVENIGDAPAYALLLRNALPLGFTPADVLDVTLTDGAGTEIGYTGQLFDPAGGLTTTPATPLAAYDANNGTNILLLTYTLQLPDRVAIPGAILPSVTTVAQYRPTPAGTPVATTVSAGTTIATAYPTIAITSPTSPLALGATGTFTVTITLPEGQVTDLRLDDLLSPMLSFVSASVVSTGQKLSGVTPVLSGTTLQLGTVLDQTDGVADAQDQLVLSVVARAVQGGSGQLTATVSAADPGGASRWTASASAPAVVAAPALSMVITAPTVAQAGQVVTVQIRVSNTGAAPAFALQLTDHLGPGLTLVAGSISASGTGATPIVQPRGAQLGALAANETLFVTLQASVDADVAAGTTLDAGADAVGIVSAGGAAVFASAPATITAVAPRITLQRLPAGFAPGDVITITGTVVLPPGPSPDVRATIALPAGLVYVPGSAGGAAIVAGQAVTVPFGASDGLQNFAISLQARVDGTAAVGTATVGAKVSTGYSSTAADAIAVTVFNVPPVLTGIVPLQGVLDTAQASPFAGLGLSDGNTTQTETAVVRSDPAHGTLSGPGIYDAASGTLTLSGSASSVGAGLAALRFLPVRRMVPVGQISGTDLSLAITDGAGGAASASVHLDVTTANSVPVVYGAWAGQLTTTTLPVLAFTQLSLSDADVGQGGTLTIRNLSPAIGTLGGPGTLNGVFQQTGTLPQLQAAARGAVFTPSGLGQAQFAVTIDDRAGGVAQDTNTTVTVNPSTDPGGQVERFPISPTANYLTNIKGAQALLRGEVYNGPVPYLQSQFIYDGASPAVIEAQAPNSFVKTFAGDSAIRVTGGQNIVDAGRGSNFIESGPGADTFYLNGTTGEVAWDTIVNFHVGDAVTLFGFTPGVSTYEWADNDGAQGYTGRTIHAVLAGSGPVTASLTFAGKTAADTAHFAITTGSLGTLNYLAVYSL